MSHNPQGERSQGEQAEGAQSQSDTQGHPEADATPAQPAEATGQPGELAGLQDLEVPTAEMRDMFGMAWSGLEHYAQMLAEEGQLRGLIGPRELPRLYSRHLVNSAAVVPFLPRHGSVADLGSGAGLPGVVVALSRPDLEVTLIEPMERRCAWLELVAEELDLDNVRVWRGRAEEMRERFDVVTARAVANLSKLTRMASPLIAPGGVLLALKGEQAQREIDDAKYVIKKAKLLPAVLHEVVTNDDDVTRVVEVRRPR